MKGERKEKRLKKRSRPLAPQARQRRKPVRCWFSGKKVPVLGQEGASWDQEAIQARQVPLWDQEESNT